MLEQECRDLKDELKTMSKSRYELENTVCELQDEMVTMKRKFECELENENKRSSKLRKKMIKSNEKYDAIKKDLNEKYDAIKKDLKEKESQLTVFRDKAAKEEQKKEQREMMENMLRVHAENTKNGCIIM